MQRPRVALIVIYCGDLDANCDFYARLGLQLVSEQHGNGPCHWAAELAEGVVLELYPAINGRLPSTLRLGLVVTASQAKPPIQPGHYLLHDPDGRAVDLRAV